MKVFLTVVKGLETGRIFEFTEPATFLIGRGHDAHFQLTNDPYISRRHFLLEISPPRVFLKDLDSKNTPRVNGIIKVEDELNHGDIIEVGYTQLKVDISYEFETQTVNCEYCGIPFEVLAGETPAPYCPGCRDKFETENEIDSSTPLTINCACGRDLTEIGNSDGKAVEFLGVVRYYCEHCVETFKNGPAAGKMIGPYQVLKILGEGGMGKVYQVYHAPTGRVMALKQMLYLSPKELQQRFEREIRFMREIRHPNTIRFLDSGVTSEGPYLVIEYASHGNLEDLVARGGALPPKEAVSYIVEALNGLEWIHSKKIIHRDLKPENILLQAGENNKLIPKITDFGVAKKYSEAGGTLMTKLGAKMGTVMYMPPEQIKNIKNVRETADLYAMGVTLYYLLTEEYTFDFPTPSVIEKFYQEHKGKVKSRGEALALYSRERKINDAHAIVLAEEPIPIRNRKPDLPTKFSQVVDKAVQKKIGDRYQSAAEFRQALLAAIR